MTTYISLLRGINVSGQKIIKMDALRKMYEGLGFISIQTYVQSGNVIFKAMEKDAKELETLIALEIEKEFGFNVPVIVFDVKTFQDIINNNPFAREGVKDKAFLHVTFLAEVPNVFDEIKIIEKKDQAEEIVIVSNVVYLYCPNGYGKTKLHNTFLEKKLKVPATTRNWKTCNELLSMAME